MASSDEDSASLSSPVRPRTKDAVGDEDSPTSSEEDDGTLWARPMADSRHQLPSLVYGEGTANGAK